MSRQSQTAKILTLLKEKGSVTNAELNRICFRYGARLHELRKEGHIIVTNRISDGLFSFVYKGERAEPVQQIKPKVIKRKKQSHSRQLSLVV